MDPAGPSDSHALCRSHRVNIIPSHLHDLHCFSTLASLQEPQIFREASSNPLWQQPMKEELDALHKTGTWDLVDLLSGKSVIVVNGIIRSRLSRMALLTATRLALLPGVLLRSLGLIMRRLFAPMTRLSSIMTLFASYVTRKWLLFQMDVKNDFLNGELSEEVYMKLSPGYSHPPGFPHRVCRLRQTLYGLKQAP